MSNFCFMKCSRTDYINLSVTAAFIAKVQPAVLCGAIEGHPYLQHAPQGVQALNYGAVLDQPCVP